MRRIFVVVLMIAAFWTTVGCQSRPGPVSENPPVAQDRTPDSSTPPEAQSLFPGVPRHPEADRYELAAPQRAYIRVPDQAAASVLSWYRSNLTSRGWNTVAIALPSDSVLLVSKAGQYLSLSAHNVPGGRAIVWFHLRSAPEVSADEAIVIASAADHSPARWTAGYIAEFESEVHPDEMKRPVWTVKGQRDGTVRVVVNVDALTAEPFQINTIN